MIEIYSSNPAYPRVRVTEPALRAARGSVVADLDLLNLFLREELQYKEDRGPTFIFYGSSRYNRQLGVTLVGSKRSNIQLPSSVANNRDNENNPPGVRVSRTLMHESAHLVASQNDLMGELRRSAIVAAAMSGWLSVCGAEQIYSSQDAWSTALHIGQAIAGGVAVVLADPREKIANEVATKSDNIERYGGIIQLPQLDKYWLPIVA